MKPGGLGLLAVVLLASAGCYAPRPTPAPSGSATAALTLSATAATYTLDEVRAGQVGFEATITNLGTSPILIAHPTACFPAGYQMGQTLSLEERHGRSEILLEIAQPNGQTAVLRDGPHNFDPGGLDRFTLLPNEAQQFDLGWFFQNARGRWEDDLKAQGVFLLEGQYRVQLTYRNQFPKAFVYDPATAKGGFVNAWTGELQSNVVTIEVK
jgi:hypothetical protein